MVLELVLLAVTLVDAGFAVRGIREARADRRRLVRDHINGAAMIVARANLIVERRRFVMRALLAALAVFLVLSEPSDMAGAITTAILIAVIVLDATKSTVLHEARRDAEDEERRRVVVRRDEAAD